MLKGLGAYDTGENLKNMVQFCAFWYIEIMISAAHMLEGICSPAKKFEKCAIWCVLEQILIRFCINFFKVVSL